MNKHQLEPIDLCGCGDTGYLITRTIPVDLAQGAGKIHHVPVYHCREKSCPEYNLPALVAQRIDELAEDMENLNSLETEFKWPTDEGLDNDLAPSQESLASLLLSFTLKFTNRHYEDAEIILVVPGQAIFCQSRLDKSEYYVFNYEPDVTSQGIWFSVSKFYFDEPELNYDDYLSWTQEGGHLKELGLLNQEEIEEYLTDEFGEII